MSLRTAPIVCTACGVARTRPDFCNNCSAVFGERHRCPHCLKILRVDRHKSLLWVCSGCNRARLTPDLEHCDDEAEAALVRAGWSALLRRDWVIIFGGLGTIVYAAYAVGAGVVALMILAKGGSIHREDIDYFLIATAVWAVFATAMYLLYRPLRRRVAETFERAWNRLAQAARDEMEEPVTTEALAVRLRIDVASARTLVTAPNPVAQRGYRDAPKAARVRVTEPEAEVEAAVESDEAAPEGRRRPLTPR